MKDEKTKTHVIESAVFIEKLRQATGGVPYLVLIEGVPLGKKFPLMPPRVRFGRGAHADLTIEDKSVSQQHADVLIENQEVYIEDLKSTNGTFVNDQRIEVRTKLQEGDYVRIGTTIFKFLPAGNVENIYHERMRDLATLDPLTQIFNKKYVTEFLISEFERCAKRNIPLCLILFDIDYFKKLNDTYGHLAGDYVLKKSCALLKDKVLRAKDVFGRYGGEEFMLVLPQAPLQRACEIAERMRTTLADFPFVYDGKKMKVTISIGVVERSTQMEDATALISDTDRALYKAKNSGRNQVCVI